MLKRSIQEALPLVNVREHKDAKKAAWEALEKGLAAANLIQSQISGTIYGDIKNANWTDAETLAHYANQLVTLANAMQGYQDGEWSKKIG